MNIQIFPNWVKKIALVVLIIGMVISGGDDFVEGFNAGMNATNSNHNTNEMPIDFMENLVGGKKVVHAFRIITMVSLLLFLVSKEKIEDDYIKLLRLEAYQLAFLIIVFVALLFYLFGKRTLYGLFDSVEVFLMLYLIIFYLKKRLV